MSCWTRNKDGSYSVTGNGPMRPIAVEGDTRALARQNWMFEFGRQYEEARAGNQPVYPVGRNVRGPQG